MGIVRLLIGALLVGVNAWLAGGAFEPIAREGRAVEYVLVSASLGRLGADLGFAVVLLLIVQALLVWQRLPKPRGPFLSPSNTSHLLALGWLSLSLLPLANLSRPLAGRLPAFSYMLFDLRWYWWPLVLLDLLRRIDPPLRWPSGRWRGEPRRWAVATLVVIPIATVVMFTPNLRFSGVLHGDEPKYLRYCENFYQGLGFDISKKHLLVEPSGSDGPHVLDNVRGLTVAVREEAALLLADARRLVGLTAPPRLVARPESGALFFKGKHPGTVYELHNPGLSFVLFPGYYLDRRLTGSGVGSQGEFLDFMPGVHLTLLALYAGYTLSLFGLLRTYSGDRAHAWILALAGALALPANAFAFQIYPEIAAGLIIFVLMRHVLTQVRSSRIESLAYGLLAGFLPWLHVRFGLATVVILTWLLVTRPGTWRDRLSFAAGVAVPLVALSFYTYRLTGSLIPSAKYGEGLFMGRALKGAPAFALDRVWGLFASSPIYLLALPGIGLAWRRRGSTGWILLLVAALVVPAAAEGFWAGYTTPGRLIVAICPVLLLFAADAMAAWSGRRVFVAIFVALTLVSVEAAVRYNLYHSKEFAPLVAKEFSGWRFNALFPSLGTDVWTISRADLFLLVAWSVTAFLLIAVPWWRTRGHRQPVAADPVPLGCVRLEDLFAALCAVALIGTAVSGAKGEKIDRGYLVSAKEGRERIQTAFVDVGHCVLCYSSNMGAVAPTTALGNDIALIDLRASPVYPRAGQRVHVRVRPRTPEGEYVVSVIRLELGDGSIATSGQVFGDVDEVHVYAQPGEYEIRAWVKASSDQSLDKRMTLRVAPP